MITSTSNQHIARLHALHTPKGREAEQAWLIEGLHLLNAVFEAGILPQLIVYDPDRVRSDERADQQLQTHLLEAQARRVPVYEATPAAIARASDTRTPPGIVAAVGVADLAPETVRARRRGRLRPLLLVLDAIGDPGNLGTILRSALAADVDEVLLAPGCADPLAPKVVRAGSGAHFHLPIRASLDWATIKQLLSGAPAVQQILVAETGSRRSYDTIDFTRRTAIVIGNEAHGVSAPAHALMTEAISIPMWNKVESLNAAVATSVILFEAARQCRADRK
ncbi:MAG: RNA methyltransferase [Chloroflexi bacterium]|nr:MAG: RNA methyltransferase [Chloroflexota bacterium]